MIARRCRSCCPCMLVPFADQERDRFVMIANQKRPRQWPPTEPVLPKERKVPPTGGPRPTGLSVSGSEPRSFLIILAVILFFALAAGGGYYWLNRPEKVPVAAHIVPAPIVPAPNSGSEPVPARSDTPSVNQTPRLVTGLRPLSRQPAEPPASVPEAPEPDASEPNQQQPQLAVGLRAQTEQQQSPSPTPPAEAAPPTEPPSAVIPNAKPSRRPAHHGSSPTTPQQSSSGPDLWT
jgi:hypothetical protein